MVKKTTTADTMASDSCPQKEIHAMRLRRGHASILFAGRCACLFPSRDACLPSIRGHPTTKTTKSCAYVPDAVCLLANCPLHCSSGRRYDL